MYVNEPKIMRQSKLFENFINKCENTLRTQWLEDMQKSLSIQNETTPKDDAKIFEDPYKIME